MNLKRLRGIVAVALATIAAAMFAGCSNSLAGSIDESAVGGSNARMATLSLSATGIPNDYAEQFARSYPTAAKVAARSITPNDPFDIGKTDDTTSQSNGLKFYLSGTSTTGKKLADTEVKISKNVGSNPVVYEYTKTDNTPISIDSMSWNLVLTAYKSYMDATTNEPVLRGFCSIDLRNGSGTANFTLSPENLTTTGSVKITGKFYTHDNVDSYTMGIYRKDSTSEEINETPVSTVTTDSTTGLAGFTYTCSSIAPGSYLYKMVFKNVSGVITGSFIDTLVVDPGNALDQDLGTLNIINKKPGAPTDFTASLVKDSEKPDGTYQVKLNWKNGKGETNFEVELTEFAADGTGTDTSTKKIYGMQSMDLGLTKDGVINFQGSDVWAGEGGAMTYGDEEAYFKLKLGVVYEVRIRARNYVGVSDWVARDNTNVTDSTDPLLYGTTEKINRMRIEYNLNGGKLGLYNTGTNGYDNYEGTYTEYQTWKGSNLNLLDFDTPVSGTNTHSLQKGSGSNVSPFAEWRTDLKYAASKVTTANYKNLSVTAFYGSSITGTVGMADAKKDVMLSDIEITWGTATYPGANSFTLTNTNATYVVPKKTGTPKEATNLRIVLKSNVNTYTNVQFRLGKDMIDLGHEDSVPSACTIDLDEYDTGIIQISVIADTENAKGMSQPLFFDLQ